MVLLVTARHTPGYISDPLTSVADVSGRTTTASSSGAVEPSPSPPSILNSDPVLEGTLLDEILSFSVCREAAPPGGVSPSRHSPAFSVGA